VSNTQAAIRRAEFIKSCLNEIGIRVEINPLPWHDFLESTYRGNFLLCIQGWISETGDPDNFLYPLFHTNSFGYPGNTFFFSNPEIDKMIDQARKIRNIKQRLKYYQEIEERILEEAPGVFLYHSLKNIAVRKELRGFKPHPLGILRLKYVQPYFVRGNYEFQLEGMSTRFITV
ncbi:MAG: ABC transporter substrate-binding protein, partial [candidate division WOR-3 bacterium]|nr:ABC transporter substrate-binding protein [candidate division WOR-3 bacterium]